MTVVRAPDASALRALERALPGVRLTGSGSARSILVAGAEVALRLADGRALVGRVVVEEVDGARVFLRPWGCVSLAERPRVDRAGGDGAGKGGGRLADRDETAARGLAMRSTSRSA